MHPETVNRNFSLFIKQWCRIVGSGEKVQKVEIQKLWRQKMDE